MNDRDCENCKHHTEKGCDSWDCNFERKMTRKEAIECNKNLNPQDKYKKVAMDLLTEYLESEQSVISEFSGDFKKSAMMLKKRVMMYLKRLDESENTFNELVKDMWIAEYYEAESEGEHG